LRGNDEINFVHFFAERPIISLVWGIEPQFDLLKKKETVDPVSFFFANPEFAVIL